MSHTAANDDCPMVDTTISEMAEQSHRVMELEAAIARIQGAVEYADCFYYFPDEATAQATKSLTSPLRSLLHPSLGCTNSGASTPAGPSDPAGAPNSTSSPRRSGRVKRAAAQRADKDTTVIDNSIILGGHAFSSRSCLPFKAAAEIVPFRPSFYTTHFREAARSDVEPRKLVFDASKAPGHVAYADERGENTSSLQKSAAVSSRQGASPSAASMNKKDSAEHIKICNDLAALRTLAAQLKEETARLTLLSRRVSADHQRVVKQKQELAIREAACQRKEHEMQRAAQAWDDERAKLKLQLANHQRVSAIVNRKLRDEVDELLAVLEQHGIYHTSTVKASAVSQ